jgi:glutathionylspermidine synthase
VGSVVTHRLELEADMKRVQSKVREDYTQKLESVGINFHTHDDGTPYWFEGVHYSFTESEVTKLEEATNELQRICIAAVDAVITSKDLSGFQIPEEFWPLIFDSWERDEVSIYGRFDFAYSQGGEIKMLEYNADTPTSLLEAAIGQWYWLQDFNKDKDQFNSLHERLIAAWKRARDFTSIGPITFMGLDTAEDWQTITYMRDVAEQGGWETSQMNLLDLGWDGDRNCFIDLSGVPVATAFKLYPWEHMLKEEYGQLMTMFPRPITFLEPAWKMLLSNKAILVKLWEMFPNHPNLLPASFEAKDMKGAYVKKPIFGREGANVEVVDTWKTLKGEDQGYGAEGFVYQAKANIVSFTDGDKTITPILGSWVVDGESAGMGIRESDDYITNNRSRFVPHLID